MLNYYHKYLKYKNKYLNYKNKYLNIKGGAAASYSDDSTVAITDKTKTLFNLLNGSLVRKKQELMAEKRNTEELTAIDIEIKELTEDIKRLIDNSETEKNTIHIAIKNGVHEEIILILLSNGAIPINNNETNLTILNTVILSKNIDYLYIIYKHFRSKNEYLFLPLYHTDTYTIEHIDIFKCVLALHILSDTDIIHMYIIEHTKYDRKVMIKSIVESGDIEALKVMLKEPLSHLGHPSIIARMHGISPEHMEVIDEIIINMVPHVYEMLIGRERFDNSILQLLKIFIEMIVSNNCGDNTREAKFAVAYALDTRNLARELIADAVPINFLKMELNQLLSRYKIMTGEIIENAALPDPRVLRESKLFVIMGDYYNEEHFWDTYCSTENVDMSDFVRPLLAYPIVRGQFQNHSKYIEKIIHSINSINSVMFNPLTTKEFVENITKKLEERFEEGASAAKRQKN